MRFWSNPTTRYRSATQINLDVKRAERHARQPLITSGRPWPR